MLAWPVGLLLVFHYIPIYGIVVAFKDFQPDRGILGSPWVGLRHFERFVNDPYFWRVLWNTVVLGFYSLIFGFPAPIILALLLNELRNQKFKRVIQTVSYLPNFISIVAIAGMIVNMLSPSRGIMNIMLMRLGAEPIYFMTEPRWFRFIYVSSGIWQGVGFGAIIYLAALAGVNPELYEAATIDGAHRFQQMRHISLQCIKPTISILLILAVPGILAANLEKVLLLYNPLTYEVADTLPTYMYRRALVGGDFEYGAAVGFVNSIVAFLLIFTANAAARRFSSQSEGGGTLW